MELNLFWRNSTPNKHQTRACRRLAGAHTEAGVDGGPHHPGQDIQARQQVREDSVRAGRTRRPRVAVIAATGSPAAGLAAKTATKELARPAELCAPEPRDVRKGPQQRLWSWSTACARATGKLNLVAHNVHLSSALCRRVIF